MKLKILHHGIDSGYNIKFGYVDRAAEHDVGMGLFRRIGLGDVHNRAPVQNGTLCKVCPEEATSLPGQTHTYNCLCIVVVLMRVVPPEA